MELDGLSQQVGTRCGSGPLGDRAETDGTGQACQRKRSDAKDAPPRGAAVVLQSISLPLPARAPARGNS